jgi:hypothetical protein
VELCDSQIRNYQKNIKINQINNHLSTQLWSHYPRLIVAVAFVVILFRLVMDSMFSGTLPETGI